MKKLKFLLPALGIMLSLFGCNRGPHVIIATKSENLSIKLEYTGRITLNSDKTAIANISPNGYVTYNKNGEEIFAGRGYSGPVYYKLNGDKLATLNPEARGLLADAIKMIDKHQAHH